MNHAIEMGSGAMVYKPKFHEDWLRHLRVVIVGGGHNLQKREVKQQKVAWYKEENA
jgi:hypothetical protein